MLDCGEDGPLNRSPAGIVGVAGLWLGWWKRGNWGCRMLLLRGGRRGSLLGRLVGGRLWLGWRMLRFGEIGVGR